MIHKFEIFSDVLYFCNYTIEKNQNIQMQKKNIRQKTISFIN